ncbi:50S ribosomal protein L4 [Candidatus Dojkabacteria bacterium HGW-Dojkabacteria-1]|uniref:Large ribosomal subunit protein uL4 n=1 Tax=Candidatus Dojkabacteria bacterium HGW-Dojkabacteria-1 TaxID=2013761 RepID=A0A2N2F317_9BACT|nr:ribosomal protein L4 [uncultured bacterium]PKN02553.1 MAG: 50S ribosomal protein L4 [Candidatus Dojkabacteria bacterium HGW-Dojkabacteria-1]
MAEKDTKTVKEVKLNPKVWEVPYNADLIAQVLYVFFNNERKGTSAVKGRGDVSGGGKKPWKQKGTGRARSGSIRSPLWVGGGVTFGPINRNWKRDINKKMVKKATCMMLSKRLKDNVLEFVNIDTEKEMKEMRNTVSKNIDTKTLIVSADGNVSLALRNIPHITVVEPMKLNVKNIVNAKKVLVDNESIKILEDRLTNGK